MSKCAKVLMSRRSFIGVESAFGILCFATSGNTLATTSTVTSVTTTVTHLVLLLLKLILLVVLPVLLIVLMQVLLLVLLQVLGAFDMLCFVTTPGNTLATTTVTIATLPVLLLLNCY